ncbi:MAG: RHS repeat-associated core domain-containing protein, partial [Polyangiaceae bacterium]
ILFYYHSDQLGSTGYITDRTGQILEHEEYLPSGESWFEELKNSSANNRLPWQFNGKELDETGLYYYGARYYNPRAGVWMSPDPILDQYMRGVRGASEPRNLGLYTYSWNNPVNVRDPNGMCVEDFCVGEAAAVGAFLNTPAGQRLVQAAQVGAVAAAGALLAGATTLWTKISGGDAPPPPNTPSPAPAPGSQPPAGPPPAVPPGVVPLAAGAAAAAANSPAGKQALQEGGEAVAEATEASVGTAESLAARVAPAANRLTHIFDKAEHALDDFVSASGGREKAFTLVQKAANEALAAGKLEVGPNGIIPSGNAGPIIDAGGTQIRLIGGRVVDGVVQISSFSRKGLP